jgi:hypothetical protein
MSTPDDQPAKKRAREGKDEEESVRGGLHLKPLFSKRPWYMGGKVLVSRDGSTCYCAQQGGLAVVKDFSEIIQVLAPGDDVIAFALAVSRLCRDLYA